MQYPPHNEAWAEIQAIDVWHGQPAQVLGTVDLDGSVLTTQHGQGNIAAELVRIFTEWADGLGVPLRAGHYRISAWWQWSGLAAGAARIAWRPDVTPRAELVEQGRPARDTTDA